MSDERHEESAEDRAVESLLEHLNAPKTETDEVVPGAELEGAEFCREYLETFGLLGLSQEPIAPSEGVKARLLAAVAPAETVETAERARVVAHPAGGRTEREAAGPSAWQRWSFPLAATVTIALLGLTAWQFRELGQHRTLLDEQRHTIAELSEQVGSYREGEVRLARLQDELQDTRATLTFVTAEGTEYCRLKPSGIQPLQPRSEGALFVAADHQHWYLSLEGLNPTPSGHAYQLWFLTADGPPVSAGTFDVRPGVRVELSSETMPANVNAVSITLEPVGGSSAPSGPEVLYGDDATMRVL